MKVNLEVAKTTYNKGSNEEKIINDSDVEALLDHLDTLAAQTYAVEFAPSFQQVILAAQVFLKGVKMLDEEWSKVDILQRAKEKYKNMLTAETVRFDVGDLNRKVWVQADRTFISRSKYRLAFDFDSKLKAFLQEPPTSIVVVMKDKATDQGKVTSYELSPQGVLHFLRVEKKTDRETGKVSYNDTFYFNRKKTEGGVNTYDVYGDGHSIEKDFSDDQLEHHLKSVQRAYEGTANRMQKFYDVYNSKHKVSALLMWKEGSRWIVNRVLSFGDAKEAYIGALMVKHQGMYDKLCYINPGEPKYYSHELIKSFFQNYIEKVDNMPAIIEEDIKTSERQYGVKSEGADPPGFDQYVTTAEMIVDLENLGLSMSGQQFINTLKSAIKNLNQPDKIEPHGKKLGTLRSKIDSYSHKKIDDLIQRAIKTFGKSIIEE